MRSGFAAPTLASTSRGERSSPGPTDPNARAFSNLSAHEITNQSVGTWAANPARMRSTSLALLLATACSGAIGGPGGEPDPDERPAPSPTPLVCDDGALRPGRSPLRRLTRDEYDATIRDLLGDTSSPGARLLDDERGVILVDGRAMTPLLAEQYLVAAEDVAARATTDLEALLGCAPSADCIETFVARFGRRAWRRPITDDERAELVAFYEEFVPEAGEREAVALLLERLLVSPHFLYRAELPPFDAAPETVVPLDGFQRATRLAYTLLGTTPDDALLDAAARGELDDADGVRRHAERLLDDPSSEAVVQSFFHHWLELDLLENLDKDPALFPEWSSDVAERMRHETEAFVHEVLYEGDGSYATLLTAPWSMLDAELADFYGVAHDGGEGFSRTPLDPEHHAGLLTQGAFLAPRARTYETSPIHRGMFIRGSLFCGSVPPPPENIEIVAPDPDPSLTTRERLEEHRSNEVCASCHVLMDPPGFAFEHFDAAGRFRATENELPIDATGELEDTELAEGDPRFFDGAAELAQLAAKSPQAHACFARQWFRFAYARSDDASDACAMQQLVTRFTAESLDVRALLVELTQTDTFLFRTVPDPTAPAAEAPGGGSR